MRESNGSFDSCKRLETSCLHELLVSKLPFVSLSNLSVLNFQFFLLVYPGLCCQRRTAAAYADVTDYIKRLLQASAGGEDPNGRRRRWKAR